jgi:hypothetical protein
MNILVLKLIDGTEIIGEVFVNSEVLTVNNPLQVNYFIRNPALAPVLTLHRYMPMASQKEFQFMPMHVLSTAIPKRGMVEYYHSMLKDITENFDEFIDNELMEKAGIANLEDPAHKDVAEALLERMVKKPLLN